jgi:anti-sigma regulatory factor (Ser/Thr protein kinase)
MEQVSSGSERVKWRFESSEASRAYHARHDLLNYLSSRAACGSDLGAAAVIFGELVGNVVRHAPGPITVELYWDRKTAVLRVRDAGPGFYWSGNATLPDAMAESGRGLYIVHAVSRTMQVRCLAGGGTEVTAWLPVSMGLYLDDHAI